MQIVNMESSDDALQSEKVSKDTKSAQKRRKKKHKKRGKHGSREKIASPKDDENVTLKTPDGENEKQISDQKRKQRSRSNSTKRIKDFFRKSLDASESKSKSPDVSVNNEFSFDVAYKEAQNENVQSMQSPEMFDPILKPRARLRYMTVKDAMEERRNKRSPSRHRERNDTESERVGQDRSSSLPDLTEPLTPKDVELVKTRRTKRSKSSDATIRRRGRRKQVHSDNLFGSESTELSKETGVELKETAITDDSLETLSAFPTTDIITKAFRKSDLQTSQMSKNKGVDQIQCSTSTLEKEGMEGRKKEGSVGSVENIQSFIDNESKRRESFSQFLLLSKTMPTYSTSSLARASKSRDQSPHNSYEYNSRDRSPNVCSRNSLTAINEGVAAKTFEALDRKRWSTLENSSIQKNQTDDDNGSIEAISNTNKTESISNWLKASKQFARESQSKEVNISKVSDPNFSDFKGDTKEKDTKGDTKEKNAKSDTEEKNTNIRSRILSRSEYRSPRRFQGRSVSGDRKSRHRRRSEQFKTLETKEVLKPLTPSYDIKDSPLCLISKGKLDPKIETKDAMMSQTDVLTADVEKEQNDTELNDVTNAEHADIEVKTSDSKSVVPDSQMSRSVQTSVQNLTELMGLSHEKPIHPLHPHIEISEIDPKMSTALDTDDYDTKSSLLPRKRSNKTEENSERSASDIEEVISYLTPESSPKPPKKFKSGMQLSKDRSKPEQERKQHKSATPVCSASSDSSKDNSKKSSTVDDTIEEFYDAEDDTAIQPKPRGKLSIMAIVALKRKLARQRKKKLQSKGEQDETQSKLKEQNESKTKEKVKEKEEKDNKNKEKSISKSKVENETDIFIENETNKSLSKLHQLKESDILEKLIGGDEEIIPLEKKKITFDPDDEPVASDEPLDDAILQQRQKSTRHARRRESKIRERQKKALNCCKKFIAFLFSHVGLSSLVVAYSILGGIIFQALEGNNEIMVRNDVIEKRQKCIDGIEKLAVEIKLNKRGKEKFQDEVKKLLMGFQEEIYQATAAKGWKNQETKDSNNIQIEEQWSFASSLLFAITIMTTIGYGHVAPKTNYGRIVTILYAVLGIPLTLLCLSNIGELMATGFKLLYGKVCCGVCCLLFRPRRKRIPDPEKGLLGTGGEIVVQAKDKSTSDVIHVPTSVCILLMTSYIMLGTLLFCIWEKWDVITGTYFSFITLSTIGFGDVVPGMTSANWAVKEKLVLCALYLVFGLSLIAMCFNLVQEDVKAKFRWLGSKIGLFDKSTR